ncbi:3'-5' exonuclease [Pseudidiomarina taiwanensis]|uniref:3'-5' exonuclease n=1 Tax=Pseudidiomarina taiwanensis TaxID=337250 RepID=A0A432ZLW6_9GAMM|nr:3'-5' exonuclease [Pseudidiomarina taiwanensis]RUO78362.1 3'-5' exonuclease [Pseudidiomarina taiwanensis]
MFTAVEHWWQRQQQLQKPWQQQRYIAFDAEMSGLEVKQDQLLSMGWLTMRPPVIDYGSAHYHLFSHAELDLKQSPVVHGLLSADFENSSDLRSSLEALASELEGAILLCHNITLDWNFLRRAAKPFGIRFKPLALIDTLRFEYRRMQRQQHHIERGSLSLQACRKRYGLPDYNSHHALSDALACAELFLAQAYRYGATEHTTTRSLAQVSRR